MALLDYDGIVQYATDYTGISITDNEALRFINKRRNDIANYIKQKVNKDYFCEFYSADLVLGQREYILPTASDVDKGVISIDRVEVKWNSTDEYRTLAKDQTLPDTAMDELATIPTRRGFYKNIDNSIILFPTPTASITDGLQMVSITTLPDVDNSFTSEQFFGNHTELREFNQIIAEGLVIDLYGKARQYDDRDQAKIDYEKALQNMIKVLGNRTHLVVYEERVNLSAYE